MFDSIVLYSKKNKRVVNVNYIEFIKQECIPAFGCTEPIALAYGAALARDLLGEEPKKIIAKVSGNMIKNAKAVKVPGTEGRKGLEISLVCGALLGDASKELEVLSGVDKSQLSLCDEKIKEGMVEIHLAPNKTGLYIDIQLEGEENTSRVILDQSHTNVVRKEKNGEVIFEKPAAQVEGHDVELSFEKIYEFAKHGDYREIQNILDMEIEYNYDIALEGLKHPYGSNIGKIILENDTGSLSEKLVAYAAAGSDARMAGSEKPVIINSGSGNQGITVSVPIIVYAKEHNCPKEELYRALIFANLIGLYLKEGIGKLSAYCGVVSAASAAVCGIGYLRKEEKEVLKETLSNALAVNSGLICDGAKASCAMKIASSLRNAFLAYDQAKSNNSFLSGDGIVKPDLEQTIRTVGHIARYGMKTTDEVILKEMLNDESYIDAMK